MDLHARKLSIIQEFLRIQNEDVISALENMIKKRNAELYKENLKPMSIEQLNSDSDHSLDDSENDRIIRTKELKAEIKKWN
jgi:hypothetical protein